MVIYNNSFIFLFLINGTWFHNVNFLLCLHYKIKIKKAYVISNYDFLK